MGRKSNAQKEAEELAQTAGGEKLINSPETPDGEFPVTSTAKPEFSEPSGTPIPTKEETIEIKRSDFDKMMKRLDSQAKDIDLLYRTTDKSRMAKELNKEGENLIKQAKVRTWADTGRIVMGWKLITDKSEVVNGKWMEEQTVSMVFEDGEIMTVPLLNFYRNTLKKLPADIISRTQEADHLIFKLQFPNGKTILLGSEFVN